MSIVLLLFASASQAEPPLVAENPIALGLVLPLSGARASIGEDSQQAATIALEHLEKDSLVPRGKLQLVFEDSQGDPAKGVSAYRQLVQRKTKVVITQNSNVSLPISRLVNADGVVQLAVTTTSDAYNIPNDLTFRTNASCAVEAGYIVEFLRERKALDGPLVLVTMEDEYPLSLKSYLLPLLEQARVVPRAAENFLPQETDFRALIVKLRPLRPKVVLFLGYQVAAGFFAKQQRELGLRPEILLMPVPVNNREFFLTAGDAAEGAYVSYPAVNRSHPAAAEFEQRFGKSVNAFSANTYDAVQLSALALKRCVWKPDPLCLKQALFGIKSFEGLSGQKGFDDRLGEMNDTYEILVARDGRFQALNKK